MTWEDRPRFRGLPVPWVARWSAEVRASYAVDRLSIEVDDGGSVRIGYADEVMADRDAYGGLWLREGLAPGQGEPQFGQVHTARHRSCMVTPRCQVCAARLDPDRVTFLLPPNESRGVAAMDPGSWFTVTPPTCDGCRDAAHLYCPHLRGHRLALVTVRKAGLWGVFGDVVTASMLNGARTGGGKITIERGFDGTGEYVHYRDPRLAATLCRQQVIGAFADDYDVSWVDVPDRGLSDPAGIVTS